MKSISKLHNDHSYLQNKTLTWVTPLLLIWFCSLIQWERTSSVMAKNICLRSSALTSFGKASAFWHCIFPSFETCSENSVRKVNYWTIADWKTLKFSLPWFLLPQFCVLQVQTDPQSSQTLRALCPRLCRVRARLLLSPNPFPAHNQGFHVKYCSVKVKYTERSHLIIKTHCSLWLLTIQPLVLSYHIEEVILLWPNQGLVAQYHRPISS